MLRWWREDLLEVVGGLAVAGGYRCPIDVESGGGAGVAESVGDAAAESFPASGHEFGTSRQRRVRVAREHEIGAMNGLGLAG